MSRNNNLFFEGKPIRILNLFSGLGGNRLKWENCQVTAVEFDPKIAEMYQDNNPDDIVIVGDAMAYTEMH